MACGPQSSVLSPANDRLPPPRPTARPTPADVDGATFDAVVVGGGINGTGIARDLAGRGARVLLCEQHDLAQHTSSASTKLIHGGLRYLEHGEFALVRKSLAERERLLRSAPHIMWPMRFVMPHDAAMRPAWLIRAGLFLYDHLARRDVLPGSRRVDLRTHAAGAALKPAFRTGFVYADGWVDDARLVVLAAVDAAERGAVVLTQCACAAAHRGGATWQLALQPVGRPPIEVQARALVNAAGPWAAEFLTHRAHRPAVRALRQVRGSHIVVGRLFEHDHAYLLQNDDRRITFAIPYERDFTLIGTTDVDHAGPLGEAQVTAAEVDYLCASASRYFRQPVTPADVVWRFAGVRPLLDDDAGNPAAVTRDYALDLDTDRAPLLAVWGGKLTTFRRLAEEAADLLAGPLGLKQGAWTAGALLPGGDVAGAPSTVAGRHPNPQHDFDRFAAALAARNPEVPAALCRRWARAYGTRAESLLLAPRGAEVAPGLYEVELRHLRDREWACTADDVLWRRSKLGLHYGDADRRAVADWCEVNWGAADAFSGSG